MRRAPFRAAAMGSASIESYYLKKALVSILVILRLDDHVPRAKDILNAFTAAEVSAISGLSIHMVNYLRRIDFLTPAYETGPHRRGKVRYYSYRDLLVARLIQRLRSAGVELPSLKDALVRLRGDELWKEAGEDPPTALRWLKTDGKEAFVEREDGFLEHMRADGQGAFGFVVNLGSLAAEVLSCIPLGPKRDNFSMQNHEVMVAPPTSRAAS